MRVPIVMLSGAAGSGKDTVAQFLVKNHGAVAIAQADPMKRLAAEMFGFGTATLWGPSERRNDSSNSKRFSVSWVSNWLDEVFQQPKRHGGVHTNSSLEKWFEGMKIPATARHVLQTLGTEWGRHFSKNMWVDLALSTSRKILGGDHYYQRDLGVVPFPNSSADLVVITDGRFRNELLAVRAAGGVTVKVVSPGSGLQGEAAKHASETEQQGIPDSWFDVILTNDKAHGLKQLENVVGYVATSVIRPQPCLLGTWAEAEALGVFPTWQGEP